MDTKPDECEHCGYPAIEIDWYEGKQGWLCDLCCWTDAAANRRVYKEPVVIDVARMLHAFRESQVQV